jgi:hypothetical protein
LILRSASHFVVHPPTERHNFSLLSPLHPPRATSEQTEEALHAHREDWTLGEREKRNLHLFPSHLFPLIMWNLVYCLFLVRSGKRKQQQRFVGEREIKQQQKYHNILFKLAL